MSAVKVRIAKDGSIIIPREFLKKFGLHPEEEILLEERPEGLIIQRIRKSHLDEIGRLLVETLQDADWAQLEKERGDRCF